MKQIGNLAVVCARRQNVLLQVGSEKVWVHVGAGPERDTLHAAWDDDDAIRRIVHELNFGRYAAGRNGLHTVPFPVSWTVKMKKKQKETQDILSYHSQAAGCSDKARAKASGGRQPIEECGRTGL